MFPEKFQILSTHISYRTNLFFCSIIYMLATTIVPSSTGCCSRLSPMFIVSARSAEALKSDWTEVELMLVRTYGLLDWNEWKIYRKNPHANSYITLHSDVSSMLHVTHWIRYEFIRKTAPLWISKIKTTRKNVLFIRSNLNSIWWLWQDETAKENNEIIIIKAFFSMILGCFVGSTRICNSNSCLPHSLTFISFRTLNIHP